MKTPKAARIDRWVASSKFREGWDRLKLKQICDRCNGKEFEKFNIVLCVRCQAREVNKEIKQESNS